MFKPSDMRIKSNIEAVDPIEQLKNIRNLKIYDYLVQSRKERGGKFAFQLDSLRF